MKPYLIPLALLALASLPARANLGETEAQSIARYGQPVQAQDPDNGKTFDRRLFFVHGGFFITAVFPKGQCTSMTIQKSKDAPLTADEVQAFLAANADGHAWNPVAPGPVQPSWQRSDHRASADYTSTSHTLVISAKGMPLTVMERHKTTTHLPSGII